MSSTTHRRAAQRRWQHERVCVCTHPRRSRPAEKKGLPICDTDGEAPRRPSLTPLRLDSAGRPGGAGGRGLQACAAVQQERARHRWPKSVASPSAQADDEAHQQRVIMVNPIKSCQLLPKVVVVVVRCSKS